MATLDRSLVQRWTDPAPRKSNQTPPVPASRPARRWKPFVLAAAVGAIALLAYVVMVSFAAAGPGFATAIDPVFKGAVALAAAGSCLILAQASTGRLRLAWALIGVSPLITLCVGAGTLAFYQATTGRPVPFPSPADALYLVGEAVLIAGLLSFPSSPTGATNRSRVTLDGLVIGVSLIYMGWALGLSTLYTNGIPFLTGAVALAYPMADIVMVTVLVLVLRRAPSTKYVRLSLLLAGLVAKLFADSSLAITSAGTGTQVNGHWIDIVWIAGYGFIALAAWWPVQASARLITAGPTSLWQMLLPWLGMVGAIGSSLVLARRQADQPIPGVSGGCAGRAVDGEPAALLQGVARVL
jgi:hypothetical protein